MALMLIDVEDMVKVFPLVLRRKVRGWASVIRTKRHYGIENILKGYDLQGSMSNDVIEELFYVV